MKDIIRYIAIVVLFLFAVACFAQCAWTAKHPAPAPAYNNQISAEEVIYYYGDIPTDDMADFIEMNPDFYD